MEPITILLGSIAPVEVPTTPDLKNAWPATTISKFESSIFSDLTSTSLVHQLRLKHSEGDLVNQVGQTTGDIGNTAAEVIEYLENNLERTNRQVFSPGLEVRTYQLRY